MAAVETLVTRTAAAPAGPIPATIDARPALPVSAQRDSLWDLAAQRRDEIATTIESHLGRRGTRAWDWKSKPGKYPLFVAVDSGLPVGESDIAATVDKSSLKITISVAPYLEAPILCTAELQYELRFESLSQEGRGYAFPCDAQGHVDLDALNERGLNNYLYARHTIGREFALPAVCEVALH